MSTKTLVGIALAFILVGATRLFAQNPDDSRAIVSFQRAADEYAFLHRRIERQQPPLEIGSDAETLNRAIESMAAALRVARPDAREGDLFAPAVRALFRAKIGAALHRSGLSLADLELPMDETDDPVLRVHGAMPWKDPADMPPDKNIKENITYDQYKTGSPSTAPKNPGVDGRRVVVIPIVKQDQYDAGRNTVTFDRFGIFFLQTKVGSGNGGELVAEYIDDIVLGQGGFVPGGGAVNPLMAVPVLYK